MQGLLHLPQTGGLATGKIGKGEDDECSGGDFVLLLGVGTDWVGTVIWVLFCVGVVLPVLFCVYSEGWVLAPGSSCVERDLKDFVKASSEPIPAVVALTVGLWTLEDILRLKPMHNFIVMMNLQRRNAKGLDFWGYWGEEVNGHTKECYQRRASFGYI